MSTFTTFSATELRQDSSKVFNQVQSMGWVKIKSRSRPDMVLLTQKELDELLSSKFESGFIHGQENKND